MPECAEVRIMSDFVNYISHEELFFESVEKSEVSKVKTELDPFEGGVFTISAKSRGKEMMLVMELVGGDIDGALIKKLLVTLGMSGNWSFVRPGAKNFNDLMKHAHLRLKSVKGNYLVLHDVRRFAKWKWVEGWTKGRGYCPLTEFNEFSEVIKTHWRTHKHFDSPICELMMSQYWFNGVGNYLRAEILERLDVNPFTPANELSPEKIDDLIRLTHMCIRDAYALGGGQLKDWQNPKGTSAANFKEWMKCYGKGESLIDNTKRRFWFNPKWKEEVPEKYKV